MAREIIIRDDPDEIIVRIYPHKGTSFDQFERNDALVQEKAKELALTLYFFRDKLLEKIKSYEDHESHAFSELAYIDSRDMLQAFLDEYKIDLDEMVS